LYIRNHIDHSEDGGRNNECLDDYWIKVSIDFLRDKIQEKRLQKDSSLSNNDGASHIDIIN
jgi:hypothetical protein